MVLRVIGITLIALAGLLASGPISQADARPVSPTEVAERARTKIVVLKVARGGRSVSATGFIVAPNLILTAAHAVREADSVTAWLNGAAYPATIAGRHGEFDLAILKLTRADLHLKPLDLAAVSTDLREGDPLLIVAGPAQAPGAASDPDRRVTISATFFRRVTLRSLEFDPAPALSLHARIRKGDSGSPVLRVRDGRVVGVISSRELPDADGVSHRAFAVPVEAVRRWIRDTMPREGFYLIP